MGLTVIELKQLLSDWPEKDANGEPYEVWIEDSIGCSSPVMESFVLNEADLLLSS